MARDIDYNAVRSARAPTSISSSERSVNHQLRTGRDVCECSRHTHTIALIMMSSLWSYLPSGESVYRSTAVLVLLLFLAYLQQRQSRIQRAASLKIQAANKFQKRNEKRQAMHKKMHEEFTVPGESTPEDRCRRKGGAARAPLQKPLFSRSNSSPLTQCCADPLRHPRRPPPPPQRPELYIDVVVTRPPLPDVRRHREAQRYSHSPSVESMRRRRFFSARSRRI